MTLYFALICILSFGLTIYLINIKNATQGNLEALKRQLEYNQQLNLLLNKKIEEIKAQIIKPVNARITKYGWTGNRMANGEYPYIGAVAISDRSIPLGSKVVIDDVKYDVKDYTSLWVWEKFGLTVDIYSEESENEMLKFGRRNKEAYLIN